jgi:hypothetical protein
VTELKDGDEVVLELRDTGSGLSGGPDASSGSDNKTASATYLFKSGEDASGEEIDSFAGF